MNREYVGQAYQLGEMKSVVERIEQTPPISIQIGHSLLFHPEVCLLHYLIPNDVLRRLSHRKLRACLHKSWDNGVLSTHTWQLLSSPSEIQGRPK